MLARIRQKPSAPSHIDARLCYFVSHATAVQDLRRALAHYALLLEIIRTSADRDGDVELSGPNLTTPRMRASLR